MTRAAGAGSEGSRVAGVLRGAEEGQAEVSNFEQFAAELEKHVQAAIATGARVSSSDLNCWCPLGCRWCPSARCPAWVPVQFLVQVAWRASWPWLSPPP